MRSKFRADGIEKFFEPDEVIVSKTNPQGVITYANRTFLTVSEYEERDVIGKPHNIIRHPDMPRCIFHMMWEYLKEGKEVFCYVINKTNLGNYYWVFAHVTPSFGLEGRVVGYHSNRRVPNRETIDTIIVPLYRRLRETERGGADPDKGMKASMDQFAAFLQDKGVGYEQFIFSV